MNQSILDAIEAYGLARDECWPHSETVFNAHNALIAAIQAELDKHGAFHEFVAAHEESGRCMSCKGNFCTAESRCVARGLD